MSSAGDRPALSRLVGDAPAFAREVWGRRPFLRTHVESGEDFADVFGPDTVDELVARRGLRAPFLRLAKDGSPLSDTLFTTAGGVGASVADQVSDDLLHEEFANGATIVAQGLHRTWPPLLHLAQQLAVDLGHPVQVNAYVTPPQSQGFADHYDVHDVFVLQTSGRKRWVLHEPVLEAPLQHHPWAARRGAVEDMARRDPTLDVTLEPGDVLYLPRGTVHAASTFGEISSHVTIGVHTWTPYAAAEVMAELALERAAADVAVRRSLPVGVDITSDTSGFDDARAALVRAVEELDDAAVSRALARRDECSRRLAPLSPIAQVQAALDLDGASRVRLRPHLAVTVEPVPADDAQLMLTSRRGTQRVPADRGEAVAALVSGEPVTADELGLETTRALLRAGVVLGG
ncbi:cupin domain-containing protein [Arsenicicoccus dermatophilus]|uniref:cupin domain-containing protein n=1 Tax=Arsenicicoccus dermatophilus TaxID=1076331 RepID=UPI003917005B